jgi:hypothetical protein
MAVTRDKGVWRASYWSARLRIAGLGRRAGRRGDCHKVGLKVSVEFWTDDLTGSLPETARFFSKHRVPPHPGDTMFVHEVTTATRSAQTDPEKGHQAASLNVRVMGTFRVTGRFWSVPGGELTVNLRPVGDGENTVQVLDMERERPGPWARED